MTDVDRTLTYQTPRGERAQLAAHYAYLLTTLFIPAVIFAYVFLFQVPKFREIFKDFRTTLPAFTEVTLALAVPLTYWFVWIPIALAVGGLPALLALWTSGGDRLEGRRRIGRIISGTVILTLLTLVMLAVALGLPLMKLMQSVSGGGP